MKAQRIVPPSTAFSVAKTKQKRPRIEDKEHLKFIRNLPCCVTGKRGTVEAAHIRMANPLYGKREVGGSEKPDDRWSLPLSAEEHRKQHAMNEADYWKQVGIDPFAVALALHSCSGDEEIAEGILQSNMRQR